MVNVQYAVRATLQMSQTFKPSCRHKRRLSNYFFSLQHFKRHLISVLIKNTAQYCTYLQTVINFNNKRHLSYKPTSHISSNTSWKSASPTSKPQNTINSSHSQDIISLNVSSTVLFGVLMKLRAAGNDYFQPICTGS